MKKTVARNEENREFDSRSGGDATPLLQTLKREASSIPFAPDQVSTSLELARFIGKKHRKVKGNIRRLHMMGLIDYKDILPFKHEDDNGDKRTLYELNFKACLLVILPHHTELLACLINQWMNLETDKELFIPDNIKALKAMLVSLDDWFKEAHSVQQKESRQFTHAYDLFTHGVGCVYSMNNQADELTNRS